MGGLFGGGSKPVGTSPYVNGTGAMEMMNAENQANNYTQQGTYALEDAQMNAMQTAQKAGMYREQQALAQDNAGVINQGSPLLNLEFTRSQGVIQANQILAAGQIQAQNMYQSGLAVLNQGRASLLGQQDQFITQQANANISNTLQTGKAIDQLGGAALSSFGGQLAQSMFGGGGAIGLGAGPADYIFGGAGGGGSFAPSDFLIGEGI